MTVAVRLPDRLQPLMQVAPVRPAYAAGLRAAIATVGPLAAGVFLGLPGANWMSLGGFNAALSDKGGPYRTRALTMGALGLFGGISATIATVGGGDAVVAVPLMFLWGTGSSLARVYGNAAVSVGTAVCSTFLIALSTPPHTLSVGLQRGGLLLAGVLWAMMFSLVLWPLRPYRPLRRAVAQVYQLVGLYAARMAALAEESARGAPALQPLGDRARIREALEAARAALGSARRGRAGESERGERLLVLLEMIDQCFGLLLALGELGEAAPDEPTAVTARREMANAIRIIADACAAVAAVILTDGPPLPADQIPTVTWNAAPLTAALSSLDKATRARYERAAVLLTRLVAQMRLAADTAASINGGRALDAALVPAPQPVSADTPGPLALLRGTFAFDSVAMRHALRVGITTSAAVMIGNALHLHRAYWVTLTVLVILQPYAGATLIRAVQRVAGTVLGGVLAAVIGVAVHDPRGILLAAFLLSGICVATLPLNYGVFSMFLTPTFVLLAEVNAGDWHLASVRVLNTLLGGGLALIGSRFLWTDSERDRYPVLMAHAVRAVRSYLDVVVVVYMRSTPAAIARASEARRQVGLAVINLEATLPGVLTEPGHPAEQLEGLMTFATYIRRLTATITVLLSGREDGVPAPQAANDEMRRFATGLDAVLADLEQSAAQERAPVALPELLPPSDPAADEADPLLREQLERVVRQLTVLRDALSRVVPSTVAS